VPPGPTVLTAWTGTLLRALHDRGVDGPALAAEAGIAAELLADPDRRVPLEASTRLWRLAVDATRDEALGLDVARYVRPGTFHALGQAVLASPTLRDALARICRYSSVTSDVSVATTGEDRTGVWLQITWRPGATPPAPESVDAIFSTLLRSSRFMLDRSVAPVALQLERAEPSSTAMFERVFRCAIDFGASTNRVVFDPATADRAVAGGNAALARLSDQVVVGYLAGLEADTTAKRVRTALLDLLAGGDPTLRAVGRKLHTSERTLQRQLDEEGTGFRHVLREVRQELAEAYLRSGEHSVTEVTYLLGYQETATFSRAFKQWTGVAPSRFR
jgi:AraC-like DNA-binding protein